MELQAEAERRKRAQVLESEGVRQATINESEAQRVRPTCRIVLELISAVHVRAQRQQCIAVRAGCAVVAMSRSPCNGEPLAVWRGVQMACIAACAGRTYGPAVSKTSLCKRSNSCLLCDCMHDTVPRWQRPSVRLLRCLCVLKAHVRPWQHRHRQNGLKVAGGMLVRCCNQGGLWCRRPQSTEPLVSLSRSSGAQKPPQTASR